MLNKAIKVQQPMILLKPSSFYFLMFQPQDFFIMSFSSVQISQLALLGETGMQSSQDTVRKVISIFQMIIAPTATECILESDCCARVGATYTTE